MTAWYFWLGAEAESPRLRAKVEAWQGIEDEWIKLTAPVVDSTDPQNEYE